MYNCTMTPNTSRTFTCHSQPREMRMPSVGPFELTEVEFIGLEFLRQDDERQLRKTTLRATWSGRELRVRRGGHVENPFGRGFGTYEKRAHESETECHETIVVGKIGSDNPGMCTVHSNSSAVESRC